MTEWLLHRSGKTYYDITEEREKSGKSGEVAVARIEQLVPFPFEPVQQECAKYPRAEVVWAQEEPANAGAWSFIRPRLSAVSQGLVVLPLLAPCMHCTVGFDFHPFRIPLQESHQVHRERRQSDAGDREREGPPRAARALPEEPTHYLSCVRCLCRSGSE
jgi:hypothetical protein